MRAMRGFVRRFGALKSGAAASGALALAFAVAAPAHADDLVIGAFAHDTSFGASGTPHEGGTADIQLMYRTKTFHFIYLFNPKVYAKLQFNTAGLTNFYTVGLEWRRHIFHTRFYGDFGIGGSYVDGYNTYPDHFQAGELPPPNPTAAQLARYQYDVHIYDTRKAMGSDFVFNPNFSIGYDVSRHFSVEATWDHYSNAGFGGRNPGMDTFGGRLVYRFHGLY